MATNKTLGDYREHSFHKVMCAWTHRRKKKGEKIDAIIKPSSEVKRRDKTMNRNEHKVSAKRSE